MKTPDEKFSIEAIEAAEYKAIWHGQKSWHCVAILSKVGEPKEILRIFPGWEDDIQSRYIEVNIKGVHICCLSLTNGNPAPMPIFDYYKIRWFEQLTKHAGGILASKKLVALIGDLNVCLRRLTCNKPERWLDDAFFRPEVRTAFKGLVDQDWTDAFSKTLNFTIYLGTIFIIYAEQIYFGCQAIIK